MTATPATVPPVITPDSLLQHWQGHRRLTRRFIELFPEDKLFSYSIAGMRPFSSLVLEFIGMAGPTLQGLATGNWGMLPAQQPETKQDLLKLWDDTTDVIDRLWPAIPTEAFQARHLAFGQWEGKGHDLLLYVIDNEIHHRGQASVYLRSLGLEPPFFPDRT
jgi:uncharacterized damage-inducible protein DinB